jgi:hypothetical protein
MFDEEFELTTFEKVMGIVLALLVGLLIGRSVNAEETDATFQPHQFAEFRVEYTAPDIAKLEERAIAIMRENAPGMTSAQARAFLRVDGKTHVGRCYNVLAFHALGKITQVESVVTQIENQTAVAQQ